MFKGLVMIDKTLPVLIVDDYKTTVRIVSNLLRQIGFENLDEASNGEEALQKLETGSYGLVLSDWNMEPMSGYELLTRIRRHPTLGDTPFVMITAETREENILAAKSAGADNYIIKPFTAETLRGKLEAVSID